MIESHQFYWGETRVVYNNILRPLQLFRSRINQSCDLQKFPGVQNIKAATRSLLFVGFGHRLLINRPLRYYILFYRIHRIILYQLSITLRQIIEMSIKTSELLPVALLNLMMMRPSTSTARVGGLGHVSGHTYAQCWPASEIEPLLHLCKGFPTEPCRHPAPLPPS